ncbi:hypothetical protein [Sphingobium sp. EM0848]|uniref:hypothetical protein n=1 Tax=Sphingobium sp. EM0848 TaxID=2743473 RepID=UPI00159BF6FE|nr:hypothetical protein [Sphingobium sp. EM0848]
MEVGPLDVHSRSSRRRSASLILNPQDDLYAVTKANAPRTQDAHYVELPGLGHGLFDLETDHITRLVEDFLV